jgi:hypothetical protein
MLEHNYSKRGYLSEERNIKAKKWIHILADIEICLEIGDAI